MLVIVGSKNGQKLTAASNAIPEAIVQGYNIASEVSSQPIGLQETFTGVVNRLNNLAKLSINAHFFVAFENGIVPVGTTWMDMAVVGIKDNKTGKVQFGTSAGVVVP